MGIILLVKLFIIVVTKLIIADIDITGTTGVKVISSDSHDYRVKIVIIIAKNKEMVVLGNIL